MKQIKRMILLLLAAAMLLGLSGCAGTKINWNEVPDSTGGRDVERSLGLDRVFSLNSNPRYSFNPMVATNRANQLICDLVYDNMVEINNNFEVIPNVILDWKCNDDGTLWTFTIDTERKFSNGDPVTPSDLCYSMGMCINADRFKGRFSSYQGASPSGEDQFQVALGIGDTQLVKLMNLPIIKRGTYDTKDGVRPIGSGPYCYNEDNTELHANEYYPGYKNLPVDTIYIKEYTNAADTIAAYEDSYIDVVVNDPSSYSSLGYASTNEIHTFATTNMHYVAINQESMLGRYSYFRVAMQYAFDRAYLEELLDGNAVATPIPMYPTCKDYPAQLAAALEFNLDTCKRVLEGAGVQDYDDDGMLEFMSGSPQEINLNFVICSDSAAKSGVAYKFKEDMASIGLQVTVHELTWENYKKALEDGVVQVGNKELTLDMYYAETQLRANFDLTEILQTRKEEENGVTNINFSRSNDASIEGAIQQYLLANDASRASTYYQLAEYVTRSVGSLITIGFERQQIITHRGVCKGIDANAGNPLYNFPNWTIDLG
ncbi:MAG: ABC transporter substrate-binding protein [Eubacteriales bacterium]|nr:ABC transporter substrate-binding protein [Eubacteriales bacterium]